MDNHNPGEAGGHHPPLRPVLFFGKKNRKKENRAEKNERRRKRRQGRPAGGMAIPSEGLFVVCPWGHLFRGKKENASRRHYKRDSPGAMFMLA
jgi:5'-3' exonuclease